MNHWLLEPDVFNGEMAGFIAGLERLNVPHTICKFGTPYEAYIERFPADAPVVFHGSLQAAKLILQTTKWSGVWLTLPKYECTYYYPRFGNHLLNSDYAMFPIGDLARRKDWLLNTVGRDGTVFIRPNSGFKTFTGDVLSAKAWDFALKFYPRKADPECLAIAAPAQTITREWRLVIVNNEVVGASEYKPDRTVWAPAEVLAYARTVLDEVKYRPDPAWTLDICETPAGFRVLEVGSFSCAGLYACDPEPVIYAVNKLV